MTIVQFDAFDHIFCFYFIEYRIMAQNNFSDIHLCHQVNSLHMKEALKRVSNEESEHNFYVLDIDRR